MRRRRPVLCCALVATVVGCWGSVRLYSDLRSGVEELLPTAAPSVVASRTIGPKLHTVTHLSVVLEGKDSTALERLADALTARLRALPQGSIGSVEDRTDDEAAFLRRFGGFYASLADLKEITARATERVAWEKQHANPLLHLLGEDDSSPPPLGLDRWRRTAGAQIDALGHFRHGYFETPDGHLLVLLVTPAEASTDLRSNQRLLDAVRQAVGSLHPERLDPPVRVGYGGEVAALVEEQATLVSDLASSSVVVFALVLLALWWYFRRPAAILAITSALATGCALTFGLSRLLIGHLNANTAFLGSILVGNGINVSIIFVARYLEERRLGRSAVHAMGFAWSGTLSGTFVASFAAGLAYLSLTATDFRGFNQFGVIAGLGMALCWVSAYVLLPPVLASLDGSRRRGPNGLRPWVVGTFVAGLVQKRRRAVQLASLCLVATSVLGVLSYRGNLVEYDLGRLRSAESVRNGAQHWNEQANRVFHTYLTPVVIRAETPEDLARVVTELARARARQGAADPLREIRTVDSLVPKDQAEKLPVLERLRAILTDARLEHVPAEERSLALELRPPADLRTFTLSDVPAVMRLPLVERDGMAGRIALAFPRKVGSLGPREVDEITTLIRGAILRSGAKAQAVGQSLLFGDIARSILRDGPRVTLLALVLVCAVVVIVLRRRAACLQVIASLLLGVSWLVGAAAYARVKLNFLNFVVLPITFGIGVDYAVNIVQRWRRDAGRSLHRVLEQTGGAVALCSATTIIGYGSLLFADNRALRGFGALASFAELACIASALLALPAWLPREGVQEREGSPRLAPSPAEGSRARAGLEPTA